MKVESQTLLDFFCFLVSPNSPHSPRMSGSVAFVLLVKVTTRMEVAFYDKYLISNVKMSKNHKAGSSKSKRPSTKENSCRKSTFRTKSEWFVALLLYDNKENIEDFFLLEAELIQNHEIDNDEDQDQNLGEESDSDNSDSIRLSELVTTERWPMVLLYCILQLSVMNAYITYNV